MTVDGEATQETIGDLGNDAATEDLSAKLGSQEPSRFAPGMRLGRYVLRRKIGAGAMGVVWEAHDPDLDRRLAIKVLRSRGGDEARGRIARARTIREAQALAKLNHPNVVTIHDVGTYGSGVYVVMDYVDGETLKPWLHRHTGKVAEILAVFMQAGRGLAAAHATGLVHRDFKPENVIVGVDGRVVVLDFGLARSLDDRTRSTADGLTESTPGGDAGLESTTGGHGTLSGSRFDELVSGAGQLTLDGAILGTPAYMAPEQHLAERTGPATDQFAFCVALYEALYGQSPFAGETIAVRAMRVVQGLVEPAPRGTKVPSWLRRVLLRGLAVEPDKRWPDLETLLERLADDPTKRRARWAAGIGGAALVGLTLAFALGTSEAPQRCRGAEDALAGVWDAPTKDEIRRQFTASSRPYALDVLERVMTAMDGWSDRWVTTRVAACRATRELAEQSESLLDLRMACLDDRLETLRSISARLREADDATIEKAIELVGGLPDLSPCSDASAVLSGLVVPVDPTVRRVVADLEPRIAEVVSLRKLGRDREALTIAEELVAEARSIDHTPTLARLLLLQGELLEATGDAAGAETVLFEAVRLAELTDDRPRLARNRNLLALVVGDRLDRAREGRTWAALARTAVAHAGGDTLLEAEIENNLGLIADREGSFLEEVEHLEAALALFERSEPAPALQLGGVHNNLAGILGHVGRYEDARLHARRAREIWSAEFGESHPRVAISIATMALVDDYAGDYTNALAGHRLAVSRYAASVDEHHPTLAELRSNLAITLVTLGQYDEALGELYKVLASREEVFGPEHAELAGTLSNIAGVLRLMERHEEALPLARRAVALEEGRDPESPGLALGLSGLANSLELLGRTQEALPIRERVVPLLERAHGPDSQEVIVDLANLASTRGACGLLIEGRQAAERAVQLAETDGVAPDERAFARLVLAELLLATPARDAARAKTLAQAAADDLGDLPAPAERAILERITKAEGWSLRVTPPSEE